MKGFLVITIIVIQYFGNNLLNNTNFYLAMITIVFFLKNKYGCHVKTKTNTILYKN